MPIIKNVKLRYAHLRADRPNPRWDKKNPRWEIQVYTNDPGNVSGCVNKVYCCVW